MTLRFNFDNTYACLPNHFFERVNPVEVTSPKLVMFNRKLAHDLGLCQKKPSDKYLAEIFSGRILVPGSESIALAYAGHQFGHFNWLGDGRAHLLGEHITPCGRRFDIQLKGSGKTSYSRMGDGKATLGPMLREYLISEAMHALGIASTRSLAVVLTGEQVMRERLLPGAILTRVASSHIRIGSFEYFAAKKDYLSLEILAKYTINRHYPELIDKENPYLALLKAFILRQIELVVSWLRVGFVHGVMNTDNMSLSGETIDYGPCAFMDAYNPATVFSSIDDLGRYAFANQPAIMQWNLTRFAEALLPLLDEDLNLAIEMATDALNEFPELFKQKWLDMMRCKLGLKVPHEDDESLINELLGIMQTEKLDYTNTFIELASSNDFVSKAWHEKWQKRCKKNSFCKVLMKQTNPLVIPRNHQVELALQHALEGDLKPYLKLLDVLSAPYILSHGVEAYQNPPKPSESIYRTFCGT